MFYVLRGRNRRNGLTDLTETMVEQLFPKMGQRSKFLKHLKELKIEKV